MRYLIYLILVVSTSLHAGTIHKWVDENGNVHYGDTPPISTKSENVKVQSAPNNPGKALPRLSTEQADDPAGASGDGSADPEEVSDEQAQALCENARNDLNIINTSTNIQLKQVDGSRRYLSADEVEQRRVSSQAQVDRYCN
ncbi:MAG: DUF4124 domain-containing protein [Gammaproteobacteria bacterium]|nr:DUF4124 domain-containing protein [Gammaproteobacteria bacterium]